MKTVMDVLLMAGIALAFAFVGFLVTRDQFGGALFLSYLGLVGLFMLREVRQ